MEGPASPSSNSDDQLLDLLEAEFAEDELPEPGRIEPAQPAAKRQKLGAGQAAGQACPPHPGFMGGLCIRCGALKDEDEEEPNVALRYIHRGLEISAREAERVRAGTANRVLAGRKLLLMLDLDHTLLNSSRFGEVDPQGEAVLHALMEQQPEDVPHIYCLPHMRMWTKLRPGVREFLQKAHDLFELHIYTMGDREYAAEMAKLLDPLGKLFHGRVISSADVTQRAVKDLDIVLGKEDVVLILDDTEGVWPRHRGNLVQIERYTYFPADARRFGLGWQSLLERRMDEDGERGALSVSLRVLQEVHRRYFEEGPEGPSDVRRHLSSIRRSVLGESCCILFSRVIPLDCAQPQAHPLWRLAEDLGAQCSNILGDSVTHVVATDNTDKTRWAKKHGKRVVNPNWLWCSAFTWAHADESRFPVTGASSSAAQQALQRTPEEDLAAALAAAGGGRGDVGQGVEPSGAAGAGPAPGEPAQAPVAEAGTGAAANGVLGADAGQGGEGQGAQPGDALMGDEPLGEGLSEDAAAAAEQDPGAG